LSKEALKIISDAMSEMGLNYDFMEYPSPPVYPYFTGEYQEIEPLSEDGLQETAFILNGFARDKGEEKTAFLALEDAKEKIAAYFSKVSGKTVITDKGSAVAVFYANSLVVPTGDAELKRLQINLSIKEWSVN
jgi:hypothetical protein